MLYKSRRLNCGYRADLIVEKELIELESIDLLVADLTVLATEKVTRKSLDEADQKRLVEEALAEVDFSSLAGNGEQK